jgi:hypothetical protein
MNPPVSPEPTLDDVGREFPDWLCYAPGIGGTVFARLLHVSPPVLVKGEDPRDLREAIKRAEAERAEERREAGQR